MSIRDYADYYLLSLSVCFVIGMLFYNSVRASLLLFCFSFVFEKKYSYYLCEKRRKLMRQSFKDALYSLSAGFSAGHKLPSAIEEAVSFLRLFYGNSDAVAGELEYIMLRYDSDNSPIEEMMTDFGQRSGIPEISYFSQALMICRASGGNIEKVCLKCVYMILDQMDYENTVESILSEKKFDSLMMLCIPFIILFFLNLSSFDYVQVLYTGVKGRLIMTAALALLAASGVWILKMTDLKL